MPLSRAGSSVTLAMAAGVTDRLYTFQDILDLVDETYRPANEDHTVRAAVRPLSSSSPGALVDR